MSRSTTFLGYVALTVAGLAGCSALPYLDARPLAESPAVLSGVSHTSGTFRRGSTELFHQSWRPASGKAKAAVVIIHGFKDHSGRYQAVAHKLVAAGFAVHGMDQRGHGRSSGVRTTIETFDEPLADLTAFLERVRADEPGRPIVLFGHSMGGVVSTLYALDHGASLAGLMLSAPAIRIDRLPVEVAAIQVTSALAPGLALLALPNADFSRSPRVVAEMATDPLIHNEDGPAVTVMALAEAIGSIWDRADTLSVPLLAMHGTADTLTDPRGSAELVRRAAGDSQLKLYPGLLHDLVNEPEGDAVVADMLMWLQQRLQESPNE